ncbi:hypothetical protein DICA2_A04214 [Diutina catenulata]
MLKSTLLVACAVATVSANFYDDVENFTWEGDYEPLGLTVTVPYGTYSRYDNFGTARNGEFYITVEPEHFCDGDGFDPCDSEGYSEYYSRFKGEIPNESWIFPGGLLRGSRFSGVVINGVFHYTLSPHEYADVAARVIYGYSMNQDDSISRYSKLFEKYHGAIPITAVEGADADHEPAKTMDSFDSKKHYSSYLKWQSDVAASVKTVDYVAFYNGVPVTRYYGEDVPERGAMLMLARLMASMSSVSVKETGTPPSSDVSFSTGSASLVAVNSQQASGSGAVDTSDFESSSASLNNDSASSNSKAGAALLAPLSSLLALGLMII